MKILPLEQYSRRGAALAAVLVLALSGCARDAGPEDLAGAGTGATLASEKLAFDIAVEAAQLVQDARFWPEADSLVTGEKQGLFLLDDKGNRLSQLPGAFSALDHRSDAGGLLAALVDEDRQQALVARLDANSRQWQAGPYLPRTDFDIEGLCLHRDVQGNEYLFLVGEEGVGEQWLVASHEQPLAEARRVRRLSLPPQSGHCRVDDVFELLYVNEENAGLWVYPAHPEADLGRRPVDIVEPFGGIDGTLAEMALLPGRAALALDAEAGALHRYRYTAEGWQAMPPLRLAGLEAPERLDVRLAGDGVTVQVRDDHGLHRAGLAWRPEALPAPRVLPVVPAAVQTDLMPSLGDAADDPAIWLHPERPGQSRILGTDKQSGLLSYDLTGRQLQHLPVGRLNNVDLRPGFMLGDREVDLAAATNRDRNSLHFFAIDRVSGDIADLGDIATPLGDIYGFCMFKSDGTVYAIPNDKDGTFLQYRVSAPDGKIEAEEVRRFAVSSQPEGCVADDAGQRLYVGEEAVAVWTLDARADRPAALEKVIGVEHELMRPDIEGLAVWRRGERAYLVISSQGNDSYVVTDGAPPFAVRGAFRIGANAAAGIDGASETDGLEVTAADLGGRWGDGLLVVQDGRKRMPEGTQNFKLVPWSAVAEALGL